MEEIIRFVTLAQTDRFTLTDLCEQFGISRKTAYKHLERYATGGLKALQPRSHCARCIPHRTDDAIEKLVLVERRLHRTWGPKKLRGVLLEGTRPTALRRKFQRASRPRSQADRLRVHSRAFAVNLSGLPFEGAERCELAANVECVPAQAAIPGGAADPGYTNPSPRALPRFPLLAPVKRLGA